MARLEPRVTVTEVIKDFPTMLSIDGSTNIGCVIVSEVGPELAYIQGPNQFLENYTKDGQTIPRNAHISYINAYYLSFVAGLVIARSMNSKVAGGVRIYTDDASSATLTPVRTLFNGEVELTRMANWNNIAFATPGSGEDPFKGYAIVFNNVIYFMAANDGENAECLEEILSDATLLENHPNLASYPTVDLGMYGRTLNDFIAQLVVELNVAGDYVAVANSTSLTLYHDEYTENPLVTPAKDCWHVTLTYVDSVDTMSSYSSKKHLFTIISKTPGTVGNNPYSLTIGTAATPKAMFDLTLDGETYKVSLDPDATDSSGINAYIEVLNTYNINFTVVVNDNNPTNGWTTGVTSQTFGQAFTDQTLSAKVGCLVGAITTLDEQESYRIHGLTPMGITSVQFIKALCTTGFRRKWFVAWDVPYDRVTKSAISAYGKNMPDDYNNIGLGPFDKNTGLTGWLNYIAASTLYWERVMRNKAVQSEFAPVFDQLTGVMAYTAPVKLLKKSVREDILSLQCPINYAIYNENTDSYYMNDNRTHYSTENIMNEECNVRMAHKISNDLHELMQQFKAKYNNDQTRNNVIDLITLYFQQNIMNQNFKPEEFLIICDTSNNTDKIINAGKLAVTVKIRLYHSIKEIEVLNEIYSVGGAAFTA